MWLFCTTFFFSRLSCCENTLSDKHNTLKIFHWESSKPGFAQETWCEDYKRNTWIQMRKVLHVHTRTKNFKNMMFVLDTCLWTIHSICIDSFTGCPHRNTGLLPPRDSGVICEGAVLITQRTARDARKACNQPDKLWMSIYLFHSRWFKHQNAS